MVIANVMSTFERIRIRGKLKERLTKLILYIVLFDLAFVFLFPFLYIIITSLKTPADLNDFLVNWVPRSIKLRNYLLAYQELDFFYYLKNSMLLTTVGTLGHLISCSFIGYGFARYNFPFKNVLFALVILAFIIPIQTIIVPTYMVFANLDWLNSYLPILVPTFFGLGLKGALFVFIFRQFYLGIPRELENAAKVDGCGFLRTYWLIVFPMARSVFLVVLVLSLVWHWNDFYEPAIYASLPDMSLLPARINLIVAKINQPITAMEQILALDSTDMEDHPNNAVLMAATFMVILPILVCFAFLQRKFMEGIERTGITGE